MLFKHKNKSETYLNRTSRAVYIYPIIGIFWLWTTDLHILIQITGSLFCIAVFAFFYKNPPFEYDTINITKTTLYITPINFGLDYFFNRKNMSKSYLISEMESFKSTSKLIIQMKNKEKVVINYHEWNIGFKKVKELQVILQQLMDESKAND